MKVIFLYLLSNLIINNNNHMQNQLPGFSVEIIDESLTDSLKKDFISYDIISSLSPDSLSIFDSQERTDRTWIGTNLCNLFQEILGLSCDKITKISISAPDGYCSVLSGELLSSIQRAVCAYRIKDEPVWPSKYGFIKLIFPEIRPMYWINAPGKMVIIIGHNLNPYNEYQFYFIDTDPMNAIIKKDLHNAPCITINDIFAQFNLPWNNFQVLTADGMVREFMSNEVIQKMVLQKQELGTWKLSGINAPSCLNTEQIFFITSANKGILLKSLTTHEQALWERHFWSKINVSNKDFKIELVFPNGEKVPSNLTDKYKNKKLSLHEILSQERKDHLNLDHIMVSW